MRTGSGSSSDGGKPDVAAGSAISVAPDANKSLDIISAANHKRKRAQEQSRSPNKLRPVVLLRQVPPAKVVPQPVATFPAVQVNSSPVKKGPIKFRMVDLKARPPAESPIKRTDEIAVTAETPVVEDIRTPSSELNPILSPPLATAEEFPRHKALPLESHALSSSPPDSAPEQSSTVRRTGRLRKPVQTEPVTDVRPVQIRRRAQPIVRPDGDAFSSMSATALRALTSSNTVKNQKYLAAKLETEVVRKDGARPESPAVKVRTIVQRQKEERGLERKARAERRARARRTGDPSGGDEMEGQNSSFSGDWDDDDLESSPAPLGHQRGPGDEEDYETPMRPIKRLRLGDEREEEEWDRKKRVKWDRGLATAVYLDELELRSQALPKENVTRKGCLAPAAKVSLVSEE